MSSRNPFEEIERLFERMSRQFDEASRGWETESPLGDWMGTSPAMAVDLVEHEDEYVATVDLPGFERDDVALRATDHTLRIEAERERETDAEAEHYIRHERRHATAERSLRLPEEVDTEAVSARMHNGVLTIRLPKLEATEAREIEIE